MLSSMPRNIGKVCISLYSLKLGLAVRKVRASSHTVTFSVASLIQTVMRSINKIKPFARLERLCTGRWIRQIGGILESFAIPIFFLPKGGGKKSQL